MSWRASKKRACPYSPLHTGAKGWGSCVVGREAYRDRGLIMMPMSCKWRSRAAMRSLRGTAMCAVGPEGGGALETKRGATPDLKRAFPPHPQSTIPKLLPRWSLQLRHLRGVRLTNPEPTSFLVHVYVLCMAHWAIEWTGRDEGRSAMPPRLVSPQWELAVHTTHVCVYDQIYCPERAATWGYR